MGKVFPEIDDALRRFIEKQRVFFVATAPLDAAGHVNCSPKGLDTLRVLGPRSLAYLDYTGSGIETIAHLRENGRIVVLLCAFEGPPRIVRLHGRGETVEPGSPGFEELIARFQPGPGVRSVIRVEIERISDSCGYGVPLMHFESDRRTLASWAEQKEAKVGLANYRRDKNARSIDDLPGLPSAEE